MTSPQKFTIDKNAVGQRLDKYLTEEMQDLSRSQIQKFINQGQVSINNTKPTKHRFLKINDIILVNFNSKSIIRESLMLPKIDIISINDDYIIIDKPANLVVHADQVHPLEETLAGLLIKKFPEIQTVGENSDRPGIVHRLDKNVSGVMVVARNQQSFEYLKNQFTQRLIQKKYQALVHGIIDRQYDEINFSITRKKTGFMAALPQGSAGRDSQTKISVIKNFKKYTLLSVTLITGRTHQIKVHLNAYHHPIVGEKIYTNKSIKRDRLQNTLNRPFLHAYQLAFIDLSNKKVTFISDLPPDLQNIIKQLT